MPRRMHGFVSPLRTILVFFSLVIRHRQHGQPGRTRGSGSLQRKVSLFVSIREPWPSLTELWSVSDGGGISYTRLDAFCCGVSVIRIYAHTFPADTTPSTSEVVEMRTAK
ncbi:hypothetical protein B0H13DRAFT_1158628 [Mycena leptocephala]|nr:hypothetical protein B0H13DRAFT_1158628 [Mycena leptocephala]